MIDAAKTMVPSDTSEPATPTPPNAPNQQSLSNPSGASGGGASGGGNGAAIGAAVAAAAGISGRDLNILIEKRDELYKEATTLLKKLADKGYPDAQYYLADCYANGIGTVRARQDFDRAFPLFVLAAKHGHPDACYRAGTCCEHGWGCRRENAKAVQFYK